MLVLVFQHSSITIVYFKCVDNKNISSELNFELLNGCIVFLIENAILPYLSELSKAIGGVAEWLLRRTCALQLLGFDSHVLKIIGFASHVCTLIKIKIIARHPVEQS